MWKTLSLITLALGVSACGGGGGGSAAAGSTPSADLAGTYAGTIQRDSTTENTAGIVLSSGEFFFFYDHAGNDALAGVVHGTLSASNGSGSASFIDYASGSATSGSLSAHYTTASSITGTVEETGFDAASLDLVYSVGSNATPSLTSLANTWGYNASSGDYGTFTVNAQGAISGASDSIPGCTFTGTATPTEAAYTVSLTMTNACGWSVNTLTGAAALTSSGLIIAAVTTDHAQAMAAVASVGS